MSGPLSLKEAGHHRLPASTLSVLVVDDSRPTTLLLKRTLEAIGALQVSTAESRNGALACISRQAFDLLLIDVHLDDCSGLELLQDLRAKGQLGVAVAMTADVSAHENRAYAAAGFALCLAKPLSRADLAEIVERARAPRAK